ncbi:hypothetical protein OMP38_12170 [Cohnella ginsengisoli]|uniref:Carbohydrate ABC transporter permease n=1 Tax=Cohnella ginsengisoli TaxID=425004 RepID=A0A9X4QMR1_9BACL|nr:hypothetical protein [Cohnella ginsengisoli]MDG0791542.1 hypothetical protein [Cohnella ginsengisoli]
MSKRWEQRLSEIVLWLLTLVIFIPLYFVLVNSLKSGTEVQSMTAALPSAFHFENYKKGVSGGPHGQGLYEQRHLQRLLRRDHEHACRHGFVYYRSPQLEDEQNAPEFVSGRTDRADEHGHDVQDHENFSFHQHVSWPDFALYGDFFCRSRSSCISDLSRICRPASTKRQP